VGLDHFGQAPQFDYGADRIGPLVTELKRERIGAFCSFSTISYRVDFVTGLGTTGAECHMVNLVRRGKIVYPRKLENARYPELQRRLAALHFPAWVFFAGKPEERSARRLFASAGYRRTVLGPFAVYLRPTA
jgi:hypothetical protein